MLIPYNTDAPIYYFPYATIGLIVANVVIYLATASIAANDTVEFNVDEELNTLIREIEVEEQREVSPEEKRTLRQLMSDAQAEATGSIFVLGPSDKVLWLTLMFDQINPLQWFTHNFMHADIMHLIGNMIFLWGFGLVVEGKLGWLKYLGVYSAACLLQGALVQVVMFLVSDGVGLALGASGAIYAMMAIAVLWAPKNEMSCIIFFRIVPRMIEMPIVIFGSLYLGLQLLFFFLRGFAMSSEALHLVGIAIGVPLGILFLNRKWVDCEGWDFFTVYLSNTERQEKARSEFRDRNRLAEVKAAKEELDENRSRILASMTSALEAGQHAAATAIYTKFETDLQGGQKVPTKMLPTLVNAMHKQKQWEQSIPLLVELLKRLPSEKTVAARLKLAQILIGVTDQPKQGLVVLKKLPNELPDKQAALRRKLVKAAKTALADGSFEVEIKDW